MGISKKLMMARDDLDHANWVLNCTDEEYESFEGLPRTEDDIEYYTRSVDALKQEVEELEALAVKFKLIVPESEKIDRSINTEELAESFAKQGLPHPDTIYNKDGSFKTKW